MNQDTKILLQLRDQYEPRWRHRPGQRLDAEEVRRDVLHPSGGERLHTPDNSQSAARACSTRLSMCYRSRGTRSQETGIAPVTFPSTAAPCLTAGGSFKEQ